MGSKIERRDFLALMGLGGAAAAVSCGQPKDYFEEKWQPWVENVEGSIPYVPRYYATTTGESDGCGLHVKVIDGRATKVEGNPGHPISKGALTSRQQAVIQGLYSGDRLRVPMVNGKNSTWRESLKLFHEKLNEAKGQNVSALTNVSTGAVEELWTKFIQDVSAGAGQLVRYTPFDQSDLAMASEAVFGQNAVPRFSLKGVDYVCSLGAQFLETWGDVTANSRDYADARTVDHGKRAKHVQFESKMTATGGMADEVHYAKPGSETMIALALLKEIGATAGLDGAIAAKITALTSGVTLNDAASAAGLKPDQLKHVAEELVKHKAAIVLPAETLALGEDSVKHNMAVLLLNKAVGAIGSRVNYSAAKPATSAPGHKPFADLIGAMKGGSVNMLLVKGVNPVYSAPASSGFTEAFEGAFTVVFADSVNETTAKADIVFPVHHDLEAWGEVNTYAGLDMLQQPTMRPRWEMKQAEDRLIDALNVLAGEDQTAVEGDFQAFLKASWQTRFGADDKAWKEALKIGGRYEMAETGDDLAISGNLADDAFSGLKANTHSLALVILESARFGDGSQANRGWLHEQPDAMTGVTWDSWLEISKHKAEEEGLTYGDVVTLSAGGQSVEIPVFISETMSDHSVTLATGLGHAERNYARGVNAFTFFSDSLNEGQLFSAGPMSATLAKTGKSEKMATFHLPGKGDQINTPFSLYSMDHHEDRTLFQSIGIASLGHHGKDGHHGGGHHEVLDMDSKFPYHKDKDFYPDRDKTLVTVGREETFYDPYKWEMAVDLNRCNGCGSCVTACYAENNLPIVGKDQVVKGREMAWLRINRFIGYSGEGDHKKTYVGMLPMMCQQCGSAPCESVCPSLATYHTKEGLNAMVYNRCVGTRYCSNNCSYKVRRYNWFDYKYEGDQNWQLNPAVSVRSRGVMEKCTFCAQRIREGKYIAQDQGREVKDGDFQTACQQACPSRAIAFGNIKDESSEVHAWAHDERAYRALDDHLHTKPGVSYLKRVSLDEEHHG